MSIQDYIFRRSRMMKETKRIANGLDGYFVRRGAIHWPSFDWPSQKAMAIRCPENFPPANGMRQSTIQFVMGCRIPEGSDNIDDSLLDILESDAITIMEALKQSKDPKGIDNSFVHFVQFEGSVEWSDPMHRVQGYLVTFTAKY